MLTCGIGAFASGHASIGLRGLRPHVDGPVDVTVVGRRVRRAGVRVHETAAVHRDEVEGCAASG